MKAMLAFFFLVSCSSWDREKCLTTDWYRKGVEDASTTGHGNFNPYKRACGEEGVSIGTYATHYEKGLKEGMRTWCTFQNGFNQGLEGKNATSHCDNVNPAFARGVEEGFREFRVVQRRKRDEEEQEKRYRQETEMFRSRVLNSTNTKECYVDMDCTERRACIFGRCEKSQKSCSFESDCEVRGYCREVTEYTAGGRLLSLRVCDY